MEHLVAAISVGHACSVGHWWRILPGAVAVQLNLAGLSGNAHLYGLALLNGSKYTLRDVESLAYCEIGLGLLSLFWPGYNLLTWALGFGVLHIVYGLAMYVKYERTTE